MIAGIMSHYMNIRQNRALILLLTGICVLIAEYYLLIDESYLLNVPTPLRDIAIALVCITLYLYTVIDICSALPRGKHND